MTKTIDMDVSLLNEICRENYEDLNESERMAMRYCLFYTESNQGYIVDLMDNDIKTVDKNDVLFIDDIAYQPKHLFYATKDKPIECMYNCVLYWYS